MGKEWGEGNFDRLRDSHALNDFADRFQAYLPAAQGNHIKYIWKISFKCHCPGKH